MQLPKLATAFLAITLTLGCTAAEPGDGTNGTGVIPGAQAGNGTTPGAPRPLRQVAASHRAEATVERGDRRRFGT